MYKIIYDEEISLTDEQRYIELFKGMIDDNFNRKLCKNFGKVFSLRASDDAIIFDDYNIMAADPVTFGTRHPEMTEIVGRIVEATLKYLYEVTPNHKAKVEVHTTGGKAMEYRVVRI